MLVNGVECALWQGATNSNGYGVRWFGGKTINAHRAAWIEAFGQPAEGMDVHHVCEVRACVELLHLQVLTHRENTLKGSSPSALAARQTLCIRGHEFVQGKRQRICRTCQNDASRKYRQRLKEMG